MILNVVYNFFYNKDEKDVLVVVLNNTKIYLISMSFYIILYLLINLFEDKLYKYILYIVFITDLLALIINIISNVIPSKYLLSKSIRKYIKYIKKMRN